MASSPPNKLFPNQRGFPTPNAAPIEHGCRSFSVPSDEEWFALLMGALDALRKPYNWYQNGALTQQEAADHFAGILDEAYEGGCVVAEVPAPVWEDDAEVDDEMTGEDQVWYGEVTNPEAPPGELEFSTQIGIWVLTGFLAFASFEVAFAPAIAFAAIAPKFALAWQRGDVGEVIKIFVKTVEGEYEEAATVDTSDWDVGDVRDVNIVAGEDPEPREFLIMSGEA